MRLFSSYRTAAPMLVLALLCSAAHAQDASSDPASIPSGAIPANQPAKPAHISDHQTREADDAYLAGARAMERNDLAEAQKNFRHATELNPNKPEYALSLTVAREHRLTELVQQAAEARKIGDNDRSDALLLQARALDPENPIITQHLDSDSNPATFHPVDFEALRSRVPPLSGITHLDPTPGKKDIHHRGSPEEVIRQTYDDFGITATFDTPISGQSVRLDLEDVTFQQAQHALEDMTHTFGVAVQPKSALIAKDTTDNRDRLIPLLEETLYIPQATNDAMTELANLARNIFDLKQVTASFTGGYIVLRGDERSLRTLNELYADMLDGGSDVLFDIHLYEIDKSHLVNIGANVPTALSAFSFVTEAENILNANASTLAQAIAANILNIQGLSAAQVAAKELAFLIGSGIVTSTQFSSLLGTLGTIGGLPLLGVSVSGGGTFNLLLNNSEVRTLDQIQIRSHNGEDAQFRAGTRYPIVTATYSSGVSGTLASQLAGVNVNGSSAASLLAQYGGASNVNVPQVQYEDLGITLKATPRIHRDDDVSVKLDLKIEAIGSGTLNSIPVLNNRTMTSTLTIPAGQTALLASTLNESETRAVAGIPGLSELPGFQGTDKSKEVDTTELLITITPHIVRQQRFRITSRRIAVEHTASSVQ
jgi:general secretion pathway protein D